MNKRVEKLRQESLDTKPYISMTTPTYPELINERGKVFLNKKFKAICQQIVDKLEIN